MEEVKVILAKASWCGHCTRFSPIFDKAKEIYDADELNSENRYLKKYKIDFKPYDLADTSDSNSFNLVHFPAVEKVKGYPTILVKINIDGKNDYHEVNRSLVNESSNESEDELTKEAAHKFLTNIVNLIKSLKSDKKKLFVQTGGSIIYEKTSLVEKEYRDKYLKYKMKYLKLKKY